MPLLYSRKHHGAYEEVKKSIVTEMEVGDSDGEEERKVGEACTTKCPACHGRDFCLLS